MKPNLENLKEYTSKASLTPGEKLDMFENIRAYSNANPVRSKYSILIKHSFAYASMLALLVGTSATSLAAERSLPGEALYPVKTNINENIIKTLSVTKAQKAKVNVTLVDKRMEELTEMIVLQKDSPEKIDIIATKLEEHKEELQKYIDNIEPSDIEENEEAAEIYAELESVVDTHLDILEEIAENEDDSDVNIEAPEEPAIPEVTAPAEVIVEEALDESSTEESTVDQVNEQPSDESTMRTSMMITAPQEIEMNTESQKIPEATKDIPAAETVQEIDDIVTGEEDAVSEISNFSQKLQPILTSVRQKAAEKYQATTTQRRTDIRKRIIETAEKELDITIEKTELLEIKDLFQ